MAGKDISTMAKARLHDLLMGYPTERGVVYPKDLDRIPPAPKGDVKLGGTGPIQRIETKPKPKPRVMTPEEKGRYT